MEATLTLLKRLEITDNYNYEKFQTGTGHTIFIIIELCSSSDLFRD